MPVGTISPEILAALDRGAMVLTPNQRVARTLRHAYDQARQDRGEVLWSPPAILALETWFATLWHQLLIDGMEAALLLNRSQEHALWRNTIAADREVPGLRSPDALADMAARAWHLLHLYQGVSRLHHFAHSTDARAFQRWSQSFEQTCTRKSYLTSAQLPAALEAALTQGHLFLPNSGLTLVDFDRLPPATAQFLDSMHRAGYPVERLTKTTEHRSATLYPAFDAASELRAAATWVRDQLALNPSASIAVVVPDLADRRSPLERIFDEALPPNAQYEFSLGTSLADTALADSALDLLHWSLETLPLDRISALLLSRFLTTPTETIAAAEFDAYDLRATPLLRPELTPQALLNILRASSRSGRLPGLQTSLRNLQNAAAEHHLTEAPAQSHAHWAMVFRLLLEAVGWSRTEDLDSTTYQARSSWESTLDEFATLDFDSTHVLPTAALQSLTRIVRQTIFAPESRLAPIQILGPLELGGIAFDALWFLSADDTSWPPSSASSPLLAWHLRRELGIPGVNPTHDTAAAQALTQRIAHSATEVVFSYAVHVDEGQRRPSPLLASLNLTTLPLQQPSRRPEPLPLEAHTDDESLSPLPPGVLSGGAQVFELQAACAFRAFAERRLFAAAPESRQPGLDPRDRGSLVHQVMQAFWARVESQANLRALTTAARDALLAGCIDVALRQHTPRTLSPWDSAYLEVQRRRLHALLTPWLDFERDRPPFTVDQQETELRGVRIGPLTLNLRVDRIDTTAAGPLILDYKTGAATPSEWLTDRPDKPQLPLYAVLSPAEDLAGVAFANLRAGDDLCLKGFADRAAVLDKPTRNDLSLSEQREEWYRILTDLATAFAGGDARVQPKCYPKTCQYCAQRTLCRLDPTTLQDFSDDAEIDPQSAQANYD